MIKYVLVNIITGLSLIFGLVAIIFVMRGFFYYSFGFALLAMMTDSLDGYLARLLKGESRFGSIFDTIADIVVYLLYPAAALYFTFGLNKIIGIFFIIIFVAAGIYRLVKFTANGFLVLGEKKYYIGMPVFFSHIMILLLMFLSLYNKSLPQIIAPLLLIMISIMMITKYKFRKPEGVPLIVSLIFVLGLVIFMFNI